MAKFGIIGGGAWGLAVAMKCVESGHNVSVWAHSESSVKSISIEKSSNRLPGIVLPELKASQSLSEVCDRADTIVVALASQHIQAVLGQLVLSPSQSIILLSKGLLEREKSPFISDYVRSLFPKNPIMSLSGPNIAIEIAEGKPAASVIAGDNMALVKKVQGQLSSKNFRLYGSSDLRGVECGGIFKNVIAIAAGLCDGLECGDNAKAALMTRGLGEMQKVSTFFNGSVETLTGLSGMGDMMTTCLSVSSRNRSYGELLGRGDQSQIDAFTREKTVEGARTVTLLAEIYPDLLRQCPIMTIVHEVVIGNVSPKGAITQLMTRDLISEDD